MRSLSLSAAIKTEWLYVESRITRCKHARTNHPKQQNPGSGSSAERRLKARSDQHSSRRRHRSGGAQRRYNRRGLDVFVNEPGDDFFTAPNGNAEVESGYSQMRQRPVGWMTANGDVWEASSGSAANIAKAASRFSLYEQIPRPAAAGVQRIDGV
jgi:hypothetical protein